MSDRKIVFPRFEVPPWTGPDLREIMNASFDDPIVAMMRAKLYTATGEPEPIAAIVARARRVPREN